MYCPLCAAALSDDSLVCIDPDVYCCPGCRADVEPVDEPPEHPAATQAEEAVEVVDPLTYLREFRRRFPHCPGLELRLGTCSGYPYPKALVGVVIAVYPTRALPGQGVLELLLGPATRADLLFFLRFPSLATLSLKEAEAYLQRESNENPQGPASGL